MNKHIPKSDKQLTLYRILTFAWLIAILILCFLPQNDLPKAGNIPHIDKIVHLILYAVLSVLSLLSYSNPSKPNRKLIISGIILVIGFLIELGQAFLTIDRSFSLFDILANFTGIIVGNWLFSVGRSRLYA